MKRLLIRLKHDETGMIISAELVLVVTIGVLGMSVGINSVASSINSEMNDISSAFGEIDQSYSYTGMTKFGHATVVGSAYWDARDFCDCAIIVPTTGMGKYHGSGVGTGYVAPSATVPHAASPCHGCPTTKTPHKLHPTPDPKYHKHPHPKHPHHKPPKPPKKKQKEPKFH